jgi:hypothetical protein
VQGDRATLEAIVRTHTPLVTGSDCDRLVTAILAFDAAGAEAPRPRRRPNGAGSIHYLRDRGQWVARVSLPGGRRVKRFAPTEDEARERLVDLRRAAL